MSESGSASDDSWKSESKIDNPDLNQFDGTSRLPKSRYSSKKSNGKGMMIGMVIAMGFAAFFAGSFFASTGSETVTKSEFRQEISKLDEKISRLGDKVNNIEVTGSSAQPSAPIPITDVSIDDDPMMGDPNAPITIIEFSDFQCPFCGRFYQQTLPLLIDDYINSGKVNIVYRDFPLQSIHPNALPAAVAAECADEQGMFWDYHDILFEKQNDWASLNVNLSVETFKDFAIDLDLNKEQFDTCFDTGKYVEEIQRDLNDGNDYGITGTPGFFIGNDKNGYVKISGAQPFNTFKQIIDSQLET